MSQVFGFRLNEDNLREAQALQVIKTWSSKGYSLRYILVEALITYTLTNVKQDELSSALNQIILLLEDIQLAPDSDRGKQGKSERLSSAFFNAIATASRPGLRTE